MLFSLCLFTNRSSSKPINTRYWHTVSNKIVKVGWALTNAMLQTLVFWKRRGWFGWNNKLYVRTLEHTFLNHSTSINPSTHFWLIWALNLFNLSTVPSLSLIDDNMDYQIFTKWEWQCQLDSWCRHRSYVPPVRNANISRYMNSEPWSLGDTISLFSSVWWMPALLGPRFLLTDTQIS